MKVKQDYTRYGYDTLGRLKTVTVHEKLDGGELAPGEHEVTSYAYDKVGNLDVVVLPNGVVSDYVYDSLNWLELLTHFHDTDGDRTLDAGEAMVASYDYTLNADGTRAGVVETDDLGRVTTIAWRYDGLNRLTREESGTLRCGRTSTEEHGHPLKPQTAAVIRPLQYSYYRWNLGSTPQRRT